MATVTGEWASEYQDAGILIQSVKGALAVNEAGDTGRPVDLG